MCYVYLIYLFLVEKLLYDVDAALIPILNKSENATLHLYIFCEKVLDKKYLINLNNVSQTSSKRFVESLPNFLV